MPGKNFKNMFYFNILGEKAGDGWVKKSILEVGLS